MRHIVLPICLALGITAALAGCARKQSETASSVSSDSLLASDPREDPSGDLTPQVPFPTSQTPPRQAPKPRHDAGSEPAPAQTPPPQTATSRSPARTRESPGVVVAWGSFLSVAVSDAISSETSHPGDAWSGTLKDTVFVGNVVALPAGSVVHGTVTEVKPAEAGDRALLALEITSIDAFGKTYPVSARMEPIVADSPRLRNVGAIVGGTGVGALIGKAVGGGKGAVVGGLVGGAAAGGAVARSKGYQVVLKPGSAVTFTLAKDAVVRP
jgi:hypothetical protein